MELREGVRALPLGETYVHGLNSFQQHAVGGKSRCHAHAKQMVVRIAETNHPKYIQITFYSHDICTYLLKNPSRTVTDYTNVQLLFISHHSRTSIGSRCLSTNCCRSTSTTTSSCSYGRVTLMLFRHCRCCRKLSVAARSFCL